MDKAAKTQKSMWIFCPHDVSWSKIEKTWVNNKVGASHHINQCLSKGCECDNLWERLEEREEWERDQKIP